MRKIVDFGEKIGGARKDQWGLNGLTIEDTYEMNEEEKRRFVTRDNIWPLPNAKKLVEENDVEPFVVYWQRQVRLCINKNPVILKDENFDSAIAKYICQTSYLRDIAMKCKVVEDVNQAEEIFRSFRDDSYRYASFREDAPVDHTCVSRKIFQLSYLRPRFTYYVKSKNFPYVEKKSSENKKERKKSFVPPQLTHIEREGQDYRYGFHITPEKWQHDFKFRGIEFGNWMSQSDRQISMDYCYDALKDLGVALDIDDKDIAFDGTLSLAFGARGFSHASAHYEPMRRVINLTKMHGAGCTAHEWFHALDDAISRYYHLQDGKLASMSNFQSELPKSFRSLIEHLKYDDNHNLTDYYRGSKRFDSVYSKDSFGYWASSCEMAARAFACYVKDCLGKKSDYLIAHADCYEFEFENQSICAIPQGEERELFNELFDQMFYDLKQIGILHKRPHVEVSKLYKLAEKKQSYYCNYDSILKEEGTGQLAFHL